jgi:TatD DNase family protein
VELFHLPSDANREAIVAKHKGSFLQQAKLAQEFNLPMVIHVRDAYDDMTKILSQINPPLVGEGKGGVLTGERPLPSLPLQGGGIKGVVHCFSGSRFQAQKFLDLGLYLGFTAVITFPPRKTNPKPDLDLIEVVERCPLDRILIETDAPYLAPQKYRGQRCEPWMVEEVAAKIAEIKRLSVAEIEKVTDENARRLFKKIK